MIVKTKLVISDKEYEFELYTIVRGIVKVIKFDNRVYYVENYNDPPKNKISSETPEVSVMTHDTKQDIKDLPAKRHVKHKKKKPDNNRIFSKQDFLCKIGSVRIYRSMVDYFKLPE